MVIRILVGSQTVETGVSPSIWKSDIWSKGPLTALLYGRVALETGFC
jgi:hypothetical protein